jgi:hypothetical protein
VRLAVAVGPEAGTAAYQVLERFVANPVIPVVTAQEIDRLAHFFQWVTRTVTTRVRNGNVAPTFDPDELSDLTN